MFRPSSPSPSPLPLFTFLQIQSKGVKDLFGLQESGDNVVWNRNGYPFTCSVQQPEKKSKFKGMKSFIAYNVTPSVSFKQTKTDICDRARENVL